MKHIRTKKGLTQLQLSLKIYTFQQAKNRHYQLGKKIKPCNSMYYKAFCGDAGNRTRVQTSNQDSFYMFIFRLILDLKLTENSPLKA